VNEPTNTPSPRRGQSLRLAAVGIEFFSTILGLIFVGYILDEYLHSTPWFGVIGLLLGMVLGVYRLVVGLKQLDRRA
jgi:F0F1-type ATP synthase assembly protein I